MRTLARAATSSLVTLFVALALVVSGMAVGGILSTHSATNLGNAIAGDELTAAIVTNQSARDIDAVYATGERAALATQPAERSRLLGSLYTSLLPAAGAELFSLEQLHALATRLPSPPTSPCSSGSGPRSVTCSAPTT